MNGAFVAIAMPKKEGVYGQMLTQYNDGENCRTGMKYMYICKKRWIVLGRCTNRLRIIALGVMSVYLYLLETHTTQNIACTEAGVAALPGGTMQEDAYSNAISHESSNVERASFSRFLNGCGQATNSRTFSTSQKNRRHH